MAASKKLPAARASARAPAEPHLGAFVGRTQELAGVLDLLARGARLVTLQGLGGVGKTRLARKIAGAVAAEGVPVFFVDLTAARTALDVADSLASALGVASTNATNERQVVETSARRLERLGHIVVILDNVEQIAEAVAAIVPRWLELAPELRIVATSRVRLAVRAESVVRLEPLSLEARAGEPSDAARLLVERARAAGDAVLDEQSAQELAEAVQGWPLAIELAAARLAVVTPAELLAMVRSSERAALAGGARDMPSRHRSVEDALAWSWQLLADGDQRALVHLAAFRGSFSRAAAERVLVENMYDARDALGVIARLVDASLVRRADAGNEAARYALYDAVRDDAERRGAAMGLAERVILAHARTSLAIAGEKQRALSLVSDVFSDAGRTAADELLLEQANVAVALERALTRAAEPSGADALCLDLLAAIEPMIALRGHPFTFVELAQRALARADHDGVEATRRAKAWLALGRAHVEIGALSEADAALARVDALAGPAGGALRARRLVWSARSLAIRGSLREAALSFDEAITLARANGDVEAELVAAAFGELHGSECSATWPGHEHEERAYLHFRRSGPAGDALFWAVQTGRAAVEEEAPAIAHERLSEALAAARSLGDGRAEGLALFGLGTNEMAHGDLARAEADLALAAQRLGELQIVRYAGYAKGWLGATMTLAGRPSEGAAALADAIEVLERAGDQPNAALFTSMRAASLARAGDGQHVAALLGHARRSLDPGDIWRMRGVTISEGHLDLAAGDPEAARARLPTGGSFHMLEVRIAARILTDALLAVDSARAPLRIAADGSLFELPAGPPVRVPGRGGANQRILVLLAARRVERPGTPVTRIELIAAGWPGEKLRDDAAKNRLYVALDGLRRLGLRSILVRTEEGWSLDPAVRCELTEPARL